jgi:hypothetical protein
VGNSHLGYPVQPGNPKVRRPGLGQRGLAPSCLPYPIESLQRRLQHSLCANSPTLRPSSCQNAALSAQGPITTGHHALSSATRIGHLTFELPVSARTQQIPPSPTHNRVTLQHRVTYRWPHIRPTRHSRVTEKCPHFRVTRFNRVTHL